LSFLFYFLSINIFSLTQTPYFLSRSIIKALAKCYYSLRNVYKQIGNHEIARKYKDKALVLTRRSHLNFKAIQSDSYYELLSSHSSSRGSLREDRDAPIFPALALLVLRARENVRNEAVRARKSKTPVTAETIRAALEDLQFQRPGGDALWIREAAHRFRDGMLRELARNGENEECRVSEIFRICDEVRSEFTTRGMKVEDCH
jgi:tetratricopeptide (TPR) repeat protein